MQPAHAWALGAFLVGGFAAGLALFASAFGRLRLRHAVAGTATSRARSMAMGKAELKGLARPDGAPLAAPLSGRPCVWYRWLVEEEREHRDSKGRTRKSWEAIGSGSSEAPFLLVDSTGTVRVEPSGAEVRAPQLLRYTSGALFGAHARPAGPAAAAWLSSGRRRLSEWRVDADRPLYALGVARPAPQADGGPPLLAKGRNDEAFLLSTDSEEELLKSLAWGAAGRMAGGAALALASLGFAARVFLHW